MELFYESGIWRAVFVVDGITFHRTLGAISKEQAEQELARLKQAARIVHVEDVLFSELADEWQAFHRSQVSLQRADWIASVLRRYVYPIIGNRMAKSLSSPEIVACCKSVQARGYVSTAHALIQIIGQVLRYGAQTGRAVDVTSGLHKVLEPLIVNHMPTFLRRRDIAALMRKCWAIRNPRTRIRIIMQAYTFVRSQEIDSAEWREIDWKKNLWSIPAAKMKMRRDHVVPLVPSVLDLLKQLQEWTGHSQWLFPAARREGHISQSVAIDAIRKLYPPEVFSLHGFRAMAASLLVQKGWPKAVVNRQLAHKDPDVVWTAYCRTEMLPQRRRMMRFWAEYLDGLL